MVLILSVVFVFVWSTGFTVGKFILPHADTTLFLMVRTAIAAAMFTGIALWLRLPWPPLRQFPRHLLAGVLLQGLYLSGTYWAIGHGVPPAIMALLGALQPVFTAVLAIPALGERPDTRVWAGLALGLIGVALVVQPGLQAGGDQSFGWMGLSIGLLAIFSITLGTLLQKTSIAGSDIRVSSAIQNMGSMVFTAVFVVLLGERHWDGSLALWGALAWASFVLSGVGAFLLVWLVRRGQAAKASSLMFLAPPLAALQAWFLFGDRLGTIQITGFAVALMGVVLCNWRWKVRV